MRSPLLLLALVPLACSEPVDPLAPCDNETQACDPDDPDDENENQVAPFAAPAAPNPPGSEATPVDRFGVRKVYPTLGGGREWFLPADAEKANSEWSPSNGSRGKLVKTGTAGVFRVSGGPRLPAKAPAGQKWFRNVEVTGYYKLNKKITGAGEMSPLGNYGYQLIVRGEAHRTGTIGGGSINGGVRPPSGTKAGPGYPFASGASVNAHCLAASYHVNMNVDGRVVFKKEVSHTDGYTSGAATKRPFAGGGAMATGKWYGFKLIARNQNADKAVHLEAWLDAKADGNWVKISETNDTGGWNAQEAGIDGCGAAPFKYKRDQIVSWAGPTVLFRFDNVEADVKWFSVREIAPLP
jgi:hypothetical protein